MAHKGGRIMKFRTVKYIKLWIAIPLVIILIGFGLIAARGLNLGVDFIGGSVIHVSMDNNYNVNDVRGILNDLGVSADIVSAGQNNQDIIIRLRYMEDQQGIHEEIIGSLQERYELDEEKFSIDFVGPTIGKELVRDAVKSILIASGLILIYIWIRFKLKSGVAAIIALIHDILVMIAVTSIAGIQINSSFIAAILTILGYSINDTIVVFDRVRENSKRLGRKMDMPEIVDLSINQSVIRTLNTSLTTIFSVAALYVLGVESIKDFTLPILAGLIAGSYSSLFIAGPIWAVWDKRSGNQSTAAAK
jgi:preprotein translocase subunit SecF